MERDKQNILKIVTGCGIDFVSIPSQKFEPRPISVTETERKVIDGQIQEFLDKGVIMPCENEPGESISTRFTRPQKDGSSRVSLNLRRLNHLVECQHFKMDTIQPWISFIQEDDFMGSIDLKDAHYSIPVALDF